MEELSYDAGKSMVTLSAALAIGGILPLQPALAASVVAVASVQGPGDCLNAQDAGS